MFQWNDKVQIDRALGYNLYQEHPLSLSSPPNHGKLRAIESDRARKSIKIMAFDEFDPIDREIIKQKAKEILGDVKTEDAYMYEDKEGARIIFNDNIQDKIDILPHSLHVWYEFTEPVTEFCNWLLENVYLMKEEKN